MVMKTVGSVVVLLGLAALIFAAMACLELHRVATSETAPSPDSLPLTKIVCPELFDPGSAGTKPATLARMAFNRIYLVGGAGVVLTIAGVVMIAARQARGKDEKASP